jgi:alanine racemase
MKSTWGFFEAGISTINEMEKLKRSFVLGILTNIGSSHDEGFVDLENKIKEKLILF